MKQRPFCPEEFPKDAFDAIAVDGAPDPSRHDDPQGVFKARLFLNQDVGVRQGKFLAHREGGYGLLFGNFDRQTPATLLATTLQNFSPARGTHPFSKAMCPQMLLLVGLEGSLHVKASLLLRLLVSFRYWRR